MSRFVDFWGQFYGYEVSLSEEKKQRIDYFSELSLGGDLSEQNVRRLLRWKDPRFLTDPKKGSNQPNEKVRKVMQNLSIINGFRSGQKTEEEMKGVAERIFESPTVVWRVFLLHLGKPHLYPVADQNVFRSYCLHTDSPEPGTWEDYAGYSDYFGQIANKLKIAQTIENIRPLKRIDNALFVFGQFLATYHKPQALPTSH